MLSEIKENSRVRKKYKPNPAKHRVNCQKAMARKREWARPLGICERCFHDKAVEGQFRCSGCIEDQRYKPKDKKTNFHASS